MRAALFFSWALWVACGGAPERAPDEGARATDAAVRAYREGALEDALALGERALAALPGDPAAREITARAALALGRPERAIAATEGAREEPLVRLRAAGHLARDEYGAAAGALGALPDDPWADVVTRIAERASGRSLFAREGAPRGELALRDDTALPVVAIQVEGRATHALVATSVHLTVLAPALRAEHGVADELALGALRLRDVPFVVRPLDVESEALGVELGAVLGLDVLARLGVRLEPGRVVVGEPGARPGVPRATYEGTVLVATLAIDGRAARLLLDTAGAYALAITPSGAERLGLGDAGAATVRLGAVAITDVPVARDVIDDTLEAHVAAPIDGALGWALLGSLVLELDREHVAITAE